MRKKLTNALSADNLIGSLHKACAKIKDDTTNIKPKYNLSDYLMSGFALFSLKYPSLLQFDKDRIDPVEAHNLKTLFHIDHIPSDTSLRERLDQLSPDKIRPLFTKLFSQAQRNKVLESYRYLDERYLVSVDGTGYFSSHNVHCENCCEKNHKDGTTTYYHQMLCSVLIHPERSQVIPFCPEPIQKQDGANKNDCERNAAKRLLKDLKREHPHLKLIIVEDGLASNAPHIRLLQKLEYKYILGAKPADHQWLFNWVEAASCNEYEYTDDKGCLHQFKHVNDAPLNESNQDVRVNFLEYWETKPHSKTQHFTWVTDILITDDNAMALMRGGRARWQVESVPQAHRLAA